MDERRFCAENTVANALASAEKQSPVLLHSGASNHLQLFIYNRARITLVTMEMTV